MHSFCFPDLHLVSLVYCYCSLLLALAYDDVAAITMRKPVQKEYKGSIREHVVRHLLVREQEIYDAQAESLYSEQVRKGYLIPFNSQPQVGEFFLYIHAVKQTKANGNSIYSHCHDLLVLLVSRADCCRSRC